MCEAELARLPIRDARPERVAEIRARCLAALARSRPVPVAGRPARAQWKARLEALAATGLAALYLAAAVERTLEILR